VGNQAQHSTWVEIDLAAIKNNVEFVLSHTGAAVMAIVKANGYGHGALPVAQAALQAGASYLGVARIEEALELRQAGMTAPILLLGYLAPARLKDALQAGLSLTVWDNSHLEYTSQAAADLQLPARVHLKLDTGMSRIGAPPSQAQAMVEQIQSHNGLFLEGVFTHFACADEGNPDPTNQQLAAFHHALDNISGLVDHSILIHAANSAASLTRPDAIFNMIRLGIAMYGLHPSPECPLPEAFQPALTWKTVLSQIKVLPPGRGVSYGHEYRTSHNERIGTIPLGYADGFRRWRGNTVLVNGKITPVVGRVCMDQSMLQLDGVPDCQAGDEVVIIGKQGNQRISAEDVAHQWNTINYEVVCGIGARVPRLYLPELPDD